LNLAHAEQFEQHSLTWNQLFSIVRKHYKLILIVFAAGTIGSWLTLQLFFTDRYETKASLLVKVGRENAEIPVTVLNGDLMSTGVRKEDINSEVQILSSRALVETVVDRLGVDAFKYVPPKPQSIWGYPKYCLKYVVRWFKARYEDFLVLVNLKKRLTPREMAILELSDSLKVEPEKESDVLTLKLDLPSQHLCVDAANALLQAYMERRTEIRRTAAGQDFFTAQAEENLQQLQELEQQREEARKQWKVSSPEEQRTLVLRQIADVESQIDNNQSEIAMLHKQQAAMAQSVDRQPDLLRKEQVTSRNPSIDSILERITSLELEHAKLASRYLAGAEPLAKNEEEIADLKELLAQQQPTILGSVTSEAHPVKREFPVQIEEEGVRIAGLEARNLQLKAVAAALHAELQHTDQGGDVLDAIERQHRLAEQNFLLYEKKKEEARIANTQDSMLMANVAVIAPPEYPLEPVYPRKLFIMAIALPVALLLGITLASLLEVMNDKITTGADLETAGDLEYLGSFRPSQGHSGNGDHSKELDEMLNLR
jgi:uncharacterized protein involved in exopolysaccharide biosynthesis